MLRLCLMLKKLKQNDNEILRLQTFSSFPSGIYSLKVNSGNNKIMWNLFKVLVSLLLNLNRLHALCWHLNKFRQVLWLELRTHNQMLVKEMNWIRLSFLYSSQFNNSTTSSFPKRLASWLRPDEYSKKVFLKICANPSSKPVMQYIETSQCSQYIWNL